MHCVDVMITLLRNGIVRNDKTNNKGGTAKPQAPPQAWSRIEGSIWIPGHNPRSHIGHLILTLALGPRSGTEKGAPSPFLPLAFAGVWVVANLVLGKTHYPDIITRA